MPRSNTNPAPLVILTSLAPLLLRLMTPLNKLLLCVKVIGLAPALKLELPNIVNAPVCVIAPVATAVKLLPILDSAKTKSIVFVILTSLLPVLLKVTGPERALSSVSVIGKLPVTKLALPGIVIAPACVIGPPAVKLIDPPCFNTPGGRTIGALSKVTLTLVKLGKLKAAGGGNCAPTLILRRVILRIFARLPLKITGKVPKSLANGNRISEFGTVKEIVLVPSTVKIPVCVMLPPDDKATFLPTVETPSTKGILLVKLTSLAPLLLIFTAPVNTLFCVKVIGLLPALKPALPATVNAPICVIAPLTVAVKSCPIVEVPSVKSMPLLMITLFIPLLLKLTAPLKALFCVNVIALGPALKLAVPGTVNTPVCVIAPLAVAVKLLPTLEAPNTNPALLLLILTALLPLLLKVTAPVNALF